jgi:chemotaxis protein methyltransferase CheR
MNAAPGCGYNPDRTRDPGGGGPSQQAAEVAVWELNRLTQEQFSLFQQFIYRQTGIALQDGKITLLSNRIRRRLRALQIESFDEYYRLLTGKRLPGELEQFIDAVTTNETFFFRTSGHFDWFCGPFLDDLVARAASGRHDRSVRVWSAACSSGEEAFSVAICLAENRERLAGWRVSILGTDISESVLVQARTATYGSRSLEHVSPQRLQQYFSAASAGQWGVKPAVASVCTFQRHNLLEKMRQPPFDCIFIRNVLIYFDRGSKAIAVNNLIESLAPGGYLVVGPSDGIYDMLGGLRRCANFLYQKP